MFQYDHASLTARTTSSSRRGLDITSYPPLCTASFHKYSSTALDISTIHVGGDDEASVSTASCHALPGKSLSHKTMGGFSCSAAAQACSHVSAKSNFQ